MARRKTKTEVAKVEDFQFDESELDGLDNFGFSTKPEDQILPNMSILQDNSGEVKKRHDRYKEGAEPGMIIFRSIDRIVDTEKVGPMRFQPCVYRHVWVEWEGEPGEGFSVATYPFEDRPKEAEPTSDPDNPKRVKWVMTNGNRLVDTREHYGYLLADDGSSQFIRVAMSGTNHRVSKKITTLQQQTRRPGGGDVPTWWRSILLGTEFNQRGALSWYSFIFEDGGWVYDNDQRARGRKLHDEFEEFMSNMISLDVEGGAEDDTIPV